MLAFFNRLRKLFSGEDPKPPSPSPSPSPSPEDDEYSRSKIGRTLIRFSLLIITLFSVLTAGIAILYASNSTEYAEKSFAQAKEILGILLPVLGTWVGTILAFYFSKENFNAAAQHSENLVSKLSPNEKLGRIAVIDVMLSMSNASTIKFILEKNEDEIKLKPDLIELHFDKYNRNRLPILNKDGQVIYMIHRSMVDKFIAAQSYVAGKVTADLTLKDLLADVLMKKMFTAFGTVNITDKLIAAKNKMDGNPDCSDVFVTENGTATSKALGWITNVTVEENSKL